MPLYQVGDTWYVDIAHPLTGQRIRASTRTKDKPAAQEYHDKLKHDLWRQSMLGADTPVEEHTVGDSAKVWLQDEERGNEDKYRLAWLLREDGGNLEHAILGELTTEALEEVLAKKNSSPGTYNRYRNLVVAILNRARKKGWLKAVPELGGKEEPDGRVRWLTAAEWRRLQDRLPEYMLEMARFALATGFRENNVLELEWPEVDLTRRVFSIPGDKMKNGRRFGGPLNTNAITVLNRALKRALSKVWVFPNAETGEPYYKASNKAWYKALEAAEIPDFTWHDLRHTWASWHVMNGTRLEMLQKLGGWESFEMVLRYAHLSPDHLRRAAANVKPVKR